MQPEQFEKMMEKLEEIRCGLIDVETGVEKLAVSPRKPAGQRVDSKDLLSLTPGRVESSRDLIAEKIDEMADICEHWRRNREKGLMPGAIRAALIMLSEEIVVITRVDPTKEDGAWEIAKKLGIAEA